MVRLVALLSLLSCVTAQARIGETLAECEVRYGPAVEHRAAKQKLSDQEACVFSKSRVTVTAEFHNGKVWHITYSKVGLDSSEVATLLEGNATGGPWSKPVKVAGQDVLLSSDHERIATIIPGKHSDSPITLLITTREFGAANRSDYEAKLSAVPASAKDASNYKALKGF